MLNDVSILDYNLNLLQTGGITIPRMGIAQWQSTELLIWQVAGQFLSGQPEAWLTFWYVSPPTPTPTPLLAQQHIKDPGHSAESQVAGCS